MGGGTLQDTAEGDDAVACVEKFFGNHGDFPCAGNEDYGDFGVAAGLKSRQGTIEEGIGDEFIPLADDDADFFAFSV